MHQPRIRGIAPKRRRKRLVGYLAALTVSMVLLASMVSLALASGTTFPDVPTTNPYYEAITDDAARGIVGGLANGTFGPGEPVSRQQFAKMIVLTAGYPVSEADVCPFTDVVKSDSTTLFPDNYIAVCAAKGITTGKTATTFAPYADITRYQALSMVVRAADNLQPGLLTSPPAGWTATSTWAHDPMHGADAARAEFNGLLTGLDLQALSPTGNMQRGEVAQMLHNLLAKLSSASAPAKVTLTVSAVPGSGTVAINPNQTTVAQGATVTLTAVPAAGYTFAGWAGDATGSANPLTLTMGAYNQSVRALFAPTARPFEDLGGPITSAPAVCSRSNGLLDVFARSATGTLIHKSWNGATWSDWEDLGGSLKADYGLAAVSWGPNRIDVFACTGNRALIHKWWDGSTWSDWENLGEVLAAGPAAAYRDAGGGQKSLYVFVIGHDNALWYRTFDGTSWGQWNAGLGEHGQNPNPDSCLAAVTWGTTRIDLFMCATDGALWHRYLSNLGDWSPWDRIDASMTSSPAAATWGSWAEDRCEVFARGADYGLWHRSFESSLWSPWESLQLGSVASAPAAVSWGPDRLDVFVRGTDDTLWHRWWDGTDWQP